MTDPTRRAAVTSTEGVMGGLPCIAGTRIPVHLLLELCIDRHAWLVAVQKAYPHLTQSQTIGALDWLIEHSTQPKADALQQARAEEREECANVVESLKLRDPSGLSRKEQLRIYDVLHKAAKAIREREQIEPPREAREECPHCMVNGPINCEAHRKGGE